MCSQWACRSLSVILILFNFHLSLMLLWGSWALLWTSPSPITPPSPCSVLWITQEPWSTSVCYYLARGKMLSSCNCLASSHYSNISQTQGPWKALEINICVAFKSPYIYLLWVVWHLRCNITLLWISMLLFVGLIWYLPYGRKWFNLTKPDCCCTTGCDKRNN